MIVHLFEGLHFCVWLWNWRTWFTCVICYVGRVAFVFCFIDLTNLMQWLFIWVDVCCCVEYSKWNRLLFEVTLRLNLPTNYPGYYQIHGGSIYNSSTRLFIYINIRTLPLKCKVVGLPATNARWRYYRYGRANSATTIPLIYSTTWWLVSNKSGTPAKHVTLTFKWSCRQFPSIPVSGCVLEMRCFQIPIRFSWCVYLFALPAGLAELSYMSYISSLRSSTMTNMTNNRYILNFVCLDIIFRKSVKNNAVKSTKNANLR
jgi:hypothetical protein